MNVRRARQTSLLLNSHAIIVLQIETFGFVCLLLPQKSNLTLKEKKLLTYGTDIPCRLDKWCTLSGQLTSSLAALLLVFK